MKKVIVLGILSACLLLTACDGVNVGIIGGADGPTNIIVSNEKGDNEHSYDAEKFFKDNYVDERKLPILDIHIENPFISDDRTLILDDTIENHLELMIYEYYKNLMSGQYQQAKDVIVDGSLLAATEAYENNFKEGIYYSQILLDEIDLVDRDELDEITEKNKYAIVELLDNLDMTEFAIVEVEKTIKHNAKSLSLVPQVGNGEVTRYYVLGKKDNAYKIVEVYWEGFIND